MEPSSDRTRSVPPQEVELRFRDEARAQEAFRSGCRHPRLGLAMAEFIQLSTARQGSRRFRSFLQGAWRAVEWALLLGMRLLALPVIGALPLQHQAGIHRQRAPGQPTPAGA